LQNVMIIGGGQGGTAIFDILNQSEMLRVKAVADIRPEAPALLKAKEQGILTGKDWKTLLTDEIDIVIDVTGDERVHRALLAEKRGFTIIPGSIAYVIVKLIHEKEALIRQLKNQARKNELIIQSINDGMIIIDAEGTITAFNRAAERMTGIGGKDAIGKPIDQVIPSSDLPQTLAAKIPAIHEKYTFPNGTKVIASRIPILDDGGRVLGAFAVFKDVTELVSLAEEVTNLKEVRTLLEAIIQSSNDAISVVDEKGLGIMVNPAYTRLTGLKEEDVIGKPATIDISEGESMHMKVLKTRKPVRGVRMKVGVRKKDVVVNVAPIIVDGQLKGSVGVIHDMSEILSLTAELNAAKERIRKLEAKYTFQDIVGRSDEIRIAVEQAKIAARTPATVLLRGESGTGKELFAHAIHNESDRKYNKFIRVNCAALSESLLESELFGYEEGAFSGAKRGGKKGLFEEADNGSLFLDEIGELSAKMQVKLLRVLQEKEIIRVGGTEPIPVNVRIIAATNRNLEREIAAGKFREDLYYRLNRIPIHIAPLRQRKEDIPPLCAHLIRKINHDYGRSVEGISPSALKKLESYDWPGNVRELENILGRAIIFMGKHERIIEEHHLPDFLENRPTLQKESFPGFPPGTGRSLSELLDSYEREIIRSTLAKNKGNKTKTAKELGLSIRNLYYKLEKHSIL